MFLIGVAGGSGSGKTTFAEKIMTRVRDPRVGLLSQDSYYQAVPPENLKVNGKSNFDHPGAFDWDLLKEHLTRLKRGDKVEVPVYDYTVSRRTRETIALGPCQTLIFEGIFALWDQTVRDLFDIKVYLHVDADIRFIRRLHRDVRERARTVDSIIAQYYDTVRPMHREYLEPSQQYADVIVGEETDIAADVISARVRQKMALGQPEPLF